MKKYCFLFSAFLVATLARLIPLSLIVGSHGAWFSCSTIIAPIMGYYAGMASLITFLIPLKVIGIKNVCFFLLHKTPLLLASLVYSTNSRFLPVSIALASIVLFVMHPTGQQAWLYSSYWAIPIVASFWGTHMIARAIVSTFIAHSVGSVIWLYTVPMSSDIWLALIPLVARERLCMIVIMVLCDVLIQFASQAFQAQRNVVRWRAR